MNKKLTKAQAQMVLALEGGHWLSGEKPTVNPKSVFPGQDNLDIGYRRTFSGMVASGYFARSNRVYETTPGDLYEVDVTAIRAAYNEWWKSTGYKDVFEIFPNGF